MKLINEKKNLTEKYVVDLYWEYDRMSRKIVVDLYWVNVYSGRYTR